MVMTGSASSIGQQSGSEIPSGRIPDQTHKKMALAVVAQRPELGYSATNYNASAVKNQKSLRPEFGHFYDAN